MRTNIDRLKNEIIPLLKEAGVTRSSLFGSVVRDEATEKSDVDILIELPRGKTLFDIAGLKLKLEDILGKSVDIVEYGALKPQLRERVLKEQVPIL